MKGPYQVLLTNPWATKFQWVDLWIHVSHLNKAPNPDWICTPTGDLKLKTHSNWSRWQLKQTSFPRWQDDVCMVSFLLFLTLFSPSLSWRSNALACIFQSFAKGVNLPECWICHQKAQSVHDSHDPLVFPIANFSFISNATANYIHTPTDIS